MLAKLKTIVIKEINHIIRKQHQGFHFEIFKFYTLMFYGNLLILNIVMNSPVKEIFKIS